jgi:CIC family chloride channel protein
VSPSDGAQPRARGRREPQAKTPATTAGSGRTARIQQWAGGRPEGLVALALIVGAGGGVGAIVFRYMIEGVTELATGRSDPSTLGRVANPHLPALSVWYLLIVPVVGGLLYGPLVSRFAPEARGHGVPEVMLAVSRRGGRIRPQVPIVKSIASALCIGTGGSVGREGPIVQIGAALGSVLGQAVRVGERRLRLLVACGAAAGISATFNAPLAGVFFALEVILRDFETQAFGVVVLSSITAAVVGRFAFGNTPFLHLPAFGVVSGVEYPLYALLGVLAAVWGVIFIRVLYGSEDLADRVWRGPEWLRPGVGGVLLGLLLVALPQMYGVGYPVLEHAVDGRYLAGFLVVLLLGKTLATSLTMAIGGSGGVFAPSLFMGAMLGSVYGQGVHALLPHSTAAAGAYALVGMGAVFAASARAPITAVLIIYELTGDYSIILPLMLAIVAATAIATHISPDTIYTLKLRRRGIDLQRRTRPLLADLCVSDAMSTTPAPIPGAAVLADVLNRFAEGVHTVLPVTDTDHRLLGVISATNIEATLQQPAGSPTAAELARTSQLIGPGDPLDDAIQALGHADDDGLPVVDRLDGTVVGWIDQHDVMRTYRLRLAEATSPPRTELQDRSQ